MDLRRAMRREQSRSQGQPGEMTSGETEQQMALSLHFVRGSTARAWDPCTKERPAYRKVF